MPRTRILFLCITLVTINCIAFYIHFRPEQPKNPAPTQVPSITPTNTPVATEEVFFVPVIGHSAVLTKDLSTFDGVVITEEQFFEKLQKLPLWEKLNLELVFGTMPSGSDTATVRIIPLSEVTTQNKILTIDNISVFTDYAQWPLILNISEGELTPVHPKNVSRLTFGGTVVLSRGVAERIEKYNNIAYPWEKISETLTSADFSFINFKGSITSDCVYDGYTLSFCGQSQYVQGMADAGIDGVSVSGNHIGDYGQRGMAETIQYLDQYSLAHTGLGNTYTDAQEPIITTMEKDDTTIGILAYNNVFGTAPCADASTGWGVTCLLDEETITKEISDLSEKVDVVIVYPNWGPEYIHTPHADAQVAWGRLFVDAGADIVLGDQAHWVQTRELYKNVPIYYGLGNIVFDQMWSDKTREGLLVHVYVANGKILTTEPIATRIYDYAQPMIEVGTVGDTILSYLTLPIQ